MLRSKESTRKKILYSNPLNPRLVMLFVSLLISYLTFSMFRSSMGVVLLEIKTEFYLTETEAGGILSATSFLMMFTLAFMGGISDRFGRKVTLLVGLMLLSLSFSLIGIAMGYITMLIYLGMAGIGASFFLPSLYSLMGETLPKSRGLNVGITNGVYSLGAFLGPIITSSLTIMYEWRILFRLFAITNIIACLFAWVFFRGSPKTYSIKKTKSVKNIESFLSILKKKNVLLLCTAACICDVGFWAGLGWMPTFLRTVQKLNIFDAGVLVGLFSLFGAVGSISIGGLSDRIGRKLLCVTTGIATAMLSYPFYMFTNEFKFLAFFSAVLGFLAYPFWNLLITMAQDSVDAKHIGAITGLVQSFGLLGGMLGPLFVGLAVASLGMSLAMLCSVSIPYFTYGILALAYHEEGLPKITRHS